AADPTAAAAGAAAAGPTAAGSGRRKAAADPTGAVPAGRSADTRRPAAARTGAAVGRCRHTACSSSASACLDHLALHPETAVEPHTHGIEGDPTTGRSRAHVSTLTASAVWSRANTGFTPLQQPRH